MEARAAMEKGIWCRDPMVPLAVMAAAMMMLPIALGVSLSIIEMQEHGSLHGTGGFSPTETEGDLNISCRAKRIEELAYDSGGLLHGTDIGTIR
jgi:hypothetical protein